MRYSWMKRMAFTGVRVAHTGGWSPQFAIMGARRYVNEVC
jgi:hypothetical protein